MHHLRNVGGGHFRKFIEQSAYPHHRRHARLAYPFIRCLQRRFAADVIRHHLSLRNFRSAHWAKRRWRPRFFCVSIIRAAVRELPAADSTASIKPPAVPDGPSFAACCVPRCNRVFRIFVAFIKDLPHCVACLAFDPRWLDFDVCPNVSTVPINFRNRIDSASHEFCFASAERTPFHFIQCDAASFASS